MCVMNSQDSGDDGDPSHGRSLRLVSKGCGACGLGTWVLFMAGQVPSSPRVSLPFSTQWYDDSALPFRVHFENVVRSDTLTL